MFNRYPTLGSALLCVASTLVSQTAFSADGDKRRIEEVVVTAERRESTVQDTAISITAFNDQMIEDFGLRNQEDLQNYIPATTIQPYDISIRGVGRVFRALGGDPGVATYFNGAYSEDFGIASTEGGLYDVERIEVLRGPQGTLYGRNGVGGAVNFHTNKPSPDFSGEIRAVTGTHGTAETYGFLNIPLVQDVLAARVTGVHREREGTVTDLGGGPALDAYGDENYALALRWTPTDTFTFDIRGNERSFRRVMTSAQGAGTILVSENAGTPDEITAGQRNTSARVFGYRPVDPTISCTSLSSRTDAITGAAAPNCTVPGLDIFTFNHNGITRTGQRVVPGVDPVASAFARPNWAYGHNQGTADAAYIGNGKSLPELTGDDLYADTSGMNDEFFDHQAGYVNASWDATDWLQVKYIGAYTDYLYSRVTDDDRTSNSLDMQFHANQENENYQHEVQFFIDIGDDITLTSGLFYYKNQIDQRLDFWSDGYDRFDAPVNYGAGVAFSPVPGNPYFEWQTARTVYGTSAAALGTDPVVPLSMNQVGWRSARDACQGSPVNVIFNPATGGTGGTVPDIVGANGTAAFSDPHVTSVCFLEGPWTGDTAAFGLGNAPDGPISDGTSFIWNTENSTEAKAVYAQGEWQVNDIWALTLGMRWAEDDKKGAENMYLYREEALTPENLFAYNVATGALNPDGTPTDAAPIRFRGIPFSQSIYRAVENKFDEVTYRVNVDWTPDGDTLVYLSYTTGYRGGGFNLGYFSATPTYDPETIKATELGYKGQLMDGTLQLNASVYHYLYENVHLQFQGNSFLGPSTVVRGHPEAVNKGVELEAVWLATDELTLGGNYSYTNARYTAELIDPETGAAGIVDIDDPLAPESLYSPAELVNLTNGHRLQRIPEQKWSGYATYRLEVATGTVDFLTSVAWTDEVSFSLTDSPLDVAQDWYRWDARVTWTSTDQRLEISGFINNITDEIGIRNMDREGESENYLRSVVPTLPRMGGVEFRYRLGAL